LAINIAIVIVLTGVLWTCMTGGILHWVPILAAVGMLWLIYNISKKERY
jgi:hypothetical protein